MFKKKYDIRIREYIQIHLTTFYCIEYTHHRFFPEWKKIKTWVPDYQTVITLFGEKHQVDDWVLHFTSIEDVLEHENSLKQNNRNWDQYEKDMREIAKKFKS